MTRSAFALIGAAVLVLAAWHRSTTQPQVAPFKITIERTATGDRLKCTEGCTWVTLSYDCPSVQPLCKFQIDQSGVSGFLSRGTEHQ
jgi:hypothetical protein